MRNPKLFWLKQEYARVSKVVFDCDNSVYGIHIYSFPRTQTKQRLTH
jgi:hypothetical protein